MGNPIIPIPPSSAPAQQTAMMNQNFANIAAESVTKIYNDRSGVPSIIEGILPDGTTGIRIGKAGVNVTTATNDQLAFNSSQNVFKIVQTGTTVIPAATSTATAGTWSSAGSIITVSHSLGYIPAVVAYADVGGSKFQIPATIFQSPLTNSSTLSIYSIACVVDISNITFSNTIALFGAHSDTNGPYNVRYYLLQETAN